MRDFVELLDAIELAVERSRGVVPDSLMADAKERVKELRRRRGFLGEVFVLAIAGTTGSGKSSLLNALAGEEVASVSHLRPHTDRPLVWLPRNSPVALDVLADELGIEQRVRHDRFDSIALIDLPDIDSVAAWHRRIVEDLLPRVDGILWVFDPEKYSDPVVHRAFLDPLSAYAEQFIFVMNKIDLLSEEGVDLVSSDLLRMLADDGHVEPLFFPVAASPSAGTPRGIQQLADYLDTQLDAKRIATGKLLTDVDSMARVLGEASDTWDGASVGFDEKWPHNRDAAAQGMLSVTGPGGREDALCRIEDLLAIIAVDVGPSVGAEIRKRFTTEVVEGVLEQAEQAALAVRTRRDNGATAATAVLDEEIGLPMRHLLRDRAVMGAHLAIAVVGVAELRARTGGYR